VVKPSTAVTVSHDNFLCKHLLVLESTHVHSEQLSFDFVAVPLQHALQLWVARILGSDPIAVMVQSP